MKLLALLILAFAIAAPVQAQASICPSMKQSQKRAIVKAFKKKYGHENVSAFWLLTDHGKNGYLVIQILRWPQVIQTIKIPVKNNCARPLFGSGVPQWWPSGIPYPVTP